LSDLLTQLEEARSNSHERGGLARFEPRRPRRRGPSLIFAGGREQVVLDAVREDDCVRDVKRRFVSEPFPGYSQHQTPIPGRRIAFTISDDAANSGRGNSKRSAVGATIYSGSNAWSAVTSA
jgi:hypothetical protein